MGPRGAPEHRARSPYSARGAPPPAARSVGRDERQPGARGSGGEVSASPPPSRREPYGGQEPDSQQQQRGPPPPPRASRPSALSRLGAKPVRLPARSRWARVPGGCLGGAPRAQRACVGQSGWGTSPLGTGAARAPRPRQTSRCSRGASRRRWRQRRGGGDGAARPPTGSQWRRRRRRRRWRHGRRDRQAGALEAGCGLMHAPPARDGLGAVAAVLVHP
jgi:hypothetical protein